MRHLIAGLALMGLITTSAQADDPLVVKQSNHSVSVTLDRLAKILGDKGITVFARVDHAAGAKKAGLDLKPTELLIFGNPKLGTPLMQSNRQIAIDLPMKVLVWEDDDGKVWLAYTAPAEMKKRHAITDRDAVFDKMNGALGKLTDAAVKAK